MPVQLYSTLSKQKEFLPAPSQQKTLRMYSCGVTVYDKCHIGHARSLYIFDVIRKYLQKSGYDVLFVRNITDVDDKIINKANETKKTFEQVVSDNITAYRKDLKDLHIDEADVEPRATENIKEMVSTIEKLIAKDSAYESQGSVYFNVRSFKDYGKLSGQSIDHMEEAVRIEADETKKDPLDFALWKKAKEGEPAWDSPWGKGRPGWHIECSCMSMKYCKTETLDIHAGGRDLVFPHHENEIAQSEALTGKPFAKYWIHHGLLTINGQKMSKSLGNFITVEDILKKNKPEDLKFFFLLSHYASPIDFTEEKIEEARKALRKFKLLIEQIFTQTHGALMAKSKTEIDHYEDLLEDAMNDDFNTPKTMSYFFELASHLNKILAKDKKTDNDMDALKVGYRLFKSFFGEVFGLLRDEKVGDLSSEEENLINDRVLARQNKDFKRSDELRDQLKEMGVIVEDKKEGQRWRRA